MVVWVRLLLNVVLRLTEAFLPYLALPGTSWHRSPNTGLAMFLPLSPRSSHFRVC
jgi:hypothetical protein